MKKIILLFASNTTTSATLNTGNGNVNLNALDSGYAQKYGHQATSLMRRVIRDIIFDATPLQYLDLKIMSMKEPVEVDSDEFYYQESTFGRDPITAGSIGADIPAGATQTIPVPNTDSVALDMIVVYPNNQKGTIAAITPNTSIVVNAMTGQVLPLLATATYNVAGSLVLSNQAPVEADAASGISQYYRMNTIERSNYVQMLVMAQRWGKMELAKYQKAGTLSNYIEKNKEYLYRQFRVSLSNIWWNGEQGEVTLASGTKAKTAGGVIPIMDQVGAPSYSATLANAPAAFEQLVLDTEFGEFGKTRFFYATPAYIHYLSEQYKSVLTRYTPNDEWAKLNLKGVDIGSSKIVFVPVKRFETTSCFPATFSSTGILLDNENIEPCYLLPEESGDTLDRRNGGTLQNFVDSWISATFSMKFNNPLACGKLFISNLP